MMVDAVSDKFARIVTGQALVGVLARAAVVAVGLWVATPQAAFAQIGSAGGGGSDSVTESQVTEALDGATISTATVSTSDKVLVQDADDSDNLKTVTTQSIADLASGGKVLQVVSASAGQISTTSQIPADDTVPQSSEGAEFVTVTITPQIASSTLYVWVDTNIRTNNSQVVTLALFEDASAAAFGARLDVGNVQPRQTTFVWPTPASDTDERTYKLRIGAGGAATLTNYGSGPQDLGGIGELTRLSVWEIAP